MKRKLLLITALFISSITIAQTTYVPDDSLEARLQQLGLDYGPLDNQVFTGFIDNLESFNFGNFIVTDITGLQDFVSLKSLTVRGEITDLSPIENLVNLEELAINDVLDTSVDLSALVNLEYLYIDDAALTSLDLSNNSNLLEFAIGITPLTELNLSNNPVLDDVSIFETDLSQLNFSGCASLTNLVISYCPSLISLDVSQNTLLDIFRFDNNVLMPFLDLSTNTALIDVRARDNTALETIYIKSGSNTNLGQNFRVKDNPALTCVEVDDVAWSNTFWGFGTDYFSGFNASCTPTNDDCSQAVPITLAQPASGTTLSATNSTNTPSCQEDGITILDVWYEFVAPPSGSVTMTISAGSLVAKIAFYNSCSDAQPLFCEEGELAVENLTPNTTYYLQVWLEANTMNRDATPENENGGFVLNVQDTSTLSVNDVENTSNQLVMYPNPAKDVVTITAQTAVKEVSIYDLSGKLILKTKNNTANTQNIELSTIANGMYLVQIKTEKTTTLKKLIIN
ncbi:T9SS type A sorting domain-containing protein [Kordia sp.]|uniref:T9SS type A sorting domain-containing protein n=1 Tax=Kordia sp. TaxID=1965332 RepID=UPI003D27C407